MLKNTLETYGVMTKLFHWIIGITIILMLIAGYTMTSMAPSDDKWQLYGMHEATGITVLSFVVLRLLWRFINIQPLLPKDLPNWQKFASKTAHYLLYLFMFLMPISGILMTRFGGHEINVFNLFTLSAFEKNVELSKIFHDIHFTSAFLFAGLIGLHILAGLYHHFIRKDNVLIRMIK